MSDLLEVAGLRTEFRTEDGRFAAVDNLSYASTVAPLVHVIGDASATNQPKAGHIANQEAKVCADAIIRAFAGLAVAWLGAVWSAKDAKDAKRARPSRPGGPLASCNYDT